MMKETEWENIFITKDAPLIVKEDGDTTHYGTVYLEDGAYIEIRAGESFTIEELRSSFNMKKEDRLACVEYPTEKNAERICSYEGYDIIVTSASGIDGSRGENGGYGGGVGQRGTAGACAAKENRSQFLLAICNLERNVNVLSVGGTGGNGGNGGMGGEGWDGTSADDTGTVGGNGGRGGNGGHAGDAVGNLFVLWESEEGYELSADSKAAAGGNYGKGGAAGANGLYYDGATVPVRGEDGSRGRDGAPGKVSRIFRFSEGVNPLARLFANPADTADPKNTAPFTGSRSLDFSDPEQARRFLDHFGGKEFLSANYPNFYQAYLRTVEAAEQDKLGATLPDGTIPSSFGVTAINSGAPSAPRAGGPRGNDVSMLEVYNYTKVHDAKPQFSIITGEIQNVSDGILLDTFGVTNYGKDFEYRFFTNPLDYLGVNGKEMMETSCRTFVDSDCLLGAQYSSSDSVLVNGYNSIVQKISITAPSSTVNNNPLIYLYNRLPGSGETSDQFYTKDQVDYSDKDNTVNTLLGISGSITFNKNAGVTQIRGYSMKSDTDNRRLMVSDTGASQFNYTPGEISGFFTPAASDDNPLDVQDVTFSFPDDWKYRLNKNVYDSGAKSVIVDLLFSFYYKITITDSSSHTSVPFSIPITIKSQSALLPNQKYYEAENSTTVLIPPIKIRWGCFAADTRIRMADGTEKKICDIKHGDMVDTPSGPKTVREIYYGTEQSMIHMTAFGGSEITVTKDHPVLTKRGVIRAEHLSPEDEVKMADGSHEKLMSVYETDYAEEQPVYNIEVAGGLIFAEGFLAGEFGTQNDLSRFEESGIFGKYGAVVPGEAEETEFPKEAAAVAEELMALCRERFGIPV